jgi:ribonuclease Z
LELRVLFLGTGARAPTPERLVASTMLIRGAEHILVDCGEGTVRRMLTSIAGLGQLSTILLSHTHADHVLGLPGLLATLSEQRRAPLVVAGPAGIRELIEGFRPHFGALRFPMQMVELGAGEAIDRDGYRLETLQARHRGEAHAWMLSEPTRRGRLDVERAMAGGVAGEGLGRLAAGEDVGGVRAREVVGPPRPGRRVIISGDTAPAPAVEEAARGADLLVHEATFLESDRALARQTGHSTAADAAALAARADVGMLALTHRSSRYRDEDVAAEAASQFPRSVVPRDLDLIEIPFSDHGPPRLLRGGGRAIERS